MGEGVIGIRPDRLDGRRGPRTKEDTESFGLHGQ